MMRDRRDVTEKLRSYAGAYSRNVVPPADLLLEAEREITRLRAAAVGANVGAERKALEAIRERILTGEYQGVFHDIDAIIERALVGAEVGAGEVSPEKSSDTSVI